MSTRRERGSARFVPEPPREGDPDYDPDTNDNLRKHWIKNQQDLERLIAVEEMRQLQSKIQLCFLTNGVDHKVYCQKLYEEYKIRMNSPNYIPNDPTIETTARASVFDLK